MKKLFYYFLIATLAFNFVGCSDKGKDITANNGTLQDGDVEIGNCTYRLNKKTQKAHLLMGFCITQKKYVTGDFAVPETITYNSTNYTVTSINSGAFALKGTDVNSYGALDPNWDITSLTFHDKIDSIGDQIFSNSLLENKFKKLTIGRGIKYIGMQMASDYITVIHATTPPEFKSIVWETMATDMMIKAMQAMKLYVPSESIEAYKAHVYFKYYDIHSIDELED